MKRVYFLGLFLLWPVLASSSVGDTFREEWISGFVGNARVAAKANSWVAGFIKFSFGIDIDSPYYDGPGQRELRQINILKCPFVTRYDGLNVNCIAIPKEDLGQKTSQLKDLGYLPILILPNYANDLFADVYFIERSKTAGSVASPQ